MISLADSLFFRIDEDDVIVDIGGEWDKFARENEGSHIFKTRVLGTKLYQHIKGETSRSFVWTILDAVRKLERPIERSYRCDSPACKRFMAMRVTPEPDKKLLLEHRLVSTEAFEHPHRFTFSTKRTSSRLTRCSMCNRLQIDGVWKEPEIALSGAAKPVGAATLVIYSVCLDCKTAAALPQHFV